MSPGRGSGEVLMTPLLFVPLVAMLGTFALTLRSLGLGLVGVFAVGYMSGVIRANYVGVYTTFMFDAALFGLYVGFIILANTPELQFHIRLL